VRYPAPWRGLLLAAGFILGGTAILHAIALPVLSRTLREASLQENWGPPLQGLWLMFSTHIAVIGGYLAVAAVRPRFAADPALLVCATLLAADTALLGGFMGIFIGTILVGVSTALVIVARAMIGAQRNQVAPTSDRPSRD
jgi:hypothetical protein